MGVIKAVSVSTVFDAVYPIRWGDPVKYNFNTTSRAGTYMVIFGNTQGQCLKLLEKEAEKKTVIIHYKAPQAVNRKHDHGTLPRNTLVIYTKL